MSVNNCIFCKIIRGELPSSIVYEDDYQIAILDLFPVSKGHTLLIPKKHYVNLLDADIETGMHIYPALKKLANAIVAYTGCDGINLIQNNGEAAGQVVFHSHVHLIPRYANDGRTPPSQKNKAEIKELAEVQAGLKELLAK